MDAPIVILIFLSLAVVGIWLWLRGLLGWRVRHNTHPQCASCGYDLSGLVDHAGHPVARGGACPECGSGLSPDTVRLPSHVYRRFPHPALGAACAVLTLLPITFVWTGVRAYTPHVVQTDVVSVTSITSLPGTTLHADLRWTKAYLSTNVSSGRRELGPGEVTGDYALSLPSRGRIRAACLPWNDGTTPFRLRFSPSRGDQFDSAGLPDAADARRWLRESGIEVPDQAAREISEAIREFMVLAMHEQPARFSNATKSLYATSGNRALRPVQLLFWVPALTGLAWLLRWTWTRERVLVLPPHPHVPSLQERRAGQARTPRAGPAPQAPGDEPPPLTRACPPDLSPSSTAAAPPGSTGCPAATPSPPHTGATA
jgi:hypothetical protein